MSYIGAAREQTSIGALLAARVAATPDARFVSFDGEARTFAEAYGAAERAADALAAVGVRSGAHVALALPNCLEFLDLWFGATLLGAVLVPVNPALRGDGLRHVVEHSDADVLVADENVLGAFEAALPAGVGPRVRLARGGDRDGWEPLEQLLAADHPRAQRPALRPDQPASILYTSGTTGPPKGVVNCHNAYARAGYEFAARYVRARSDDVFYTSLPLFHVNAQMLTTIGAWVSGRPMVLAPRFTASGFFDDVRRHDATVFNYIGAMLTMIAKQPPRENDRDNPARLAVGGAAPAEVWPAFERRFGVEILEIYGLTETATFCLGSPADDIRVGKLGRPVGWSEVDVRRDDGTPADDGEAGEIVIRSTEPNVLFKGYYKDDDATARAMAGGWFASGDRGRRDPDGYFVFIDRLKDSIRRRGENISSYEIERVVNSHPSVAESAAVGVPSELGEEEVMVVVVPRRGEEIDPAALVEHCAARMGAFMVPRFVQLRDALPKTATERVRKFALREEGVAGAWDRLAVKDQS